MFKRRAPRQLHHHIREFFYPKMGWTRALKYYRHRALRLPGTPDNIARGLACGAAVSFSPFVGFHFVLSFGLAWLVGGNMLAAAVGTAVGNPVTFFFIWLLIHRTGAYILGIERNPAEVETFTHVLFKDPGRVFTDLDTFFEPVLLPMLVGCIPHVLWVWFTVYYVTKPLITEYQHLRLKRRNRKNRHESPPPRG